MVDLLVECSDNSKVGLLGSTSGWVNDASSWSRLVLSPLEWSL